ncbi:MAG: ribosome small subunit-dependent GTPase A [Candidatus Margulisiibacteriota bacterium]
MEQSSKKHTIARVVAQYRGKYRVLHENNEFWAEVSGKTIYKATSQLDFPVVGDLVSIVELGDNNSIIEGVLPRNNILQRKSAGKNESQPIAANIDTAFIVQSVDHDFNLNRFERYLSIVVASKIKPILVLNKCDLIKPEELDEKISLLKKRFKDIPILTTSTLREDGIDTLKKAIAPQQIHCLLGSSGVGKSSLINKLLGKDLLKTLEISAQTKKGKHATTHRELFVLDGGGMIIDNPGMREIGLADAKEGVRNVFVEIEKLGDGCRFIDCTHQHEPGCRVLAAVESGDLSAEKYQSYIKLKKESDFYNMTSLEKRRKDKRFGKMVKTAIKQIKKLK